MHEGKALGVKSKVQQRVSGLRWTSKVELAAQVYVRGSAFLWHQVHSLWLVWQKALITKAESASVAPSEP